MDKYKIAVQAAEVGVWSWNIIENTVECDETMYKLYGFKPSPNDNFDTWHERIHPDDVDFVDKELKWAIDGIKEFNTSFRIVRPDGSIHYIQARSKTFRENNKAFEMIGTNWDITEKKVQEADLAKKSGDVLAKNKEIESFVYAISHDLRGPILNIDGFSNELSLSLQELMIAIPPTKEIERIYNDITEAITYIHASSSKMNGLINAILSLSRLGRIDYSINVNNINKIVKEVIDSLQNEIRRANAKVIVSNLPEAICDMNAINRVFMNLIGNAVKYRKKTAPCVIEISGESEGGFVMYSVKDNGLGIPKQSAHKVFNIFQRFHETEEPGEGIGLASVNKIIGRHGGKVWFEDNGDGSTFYFSLPAVKKNGSGAGLSGGGIGVAKRY